VRVEHLVVIGVTENRVEVLQVQIHWKFLGDRVEAYLLVPSRRKIADQERAPDVVSSILLNEERLELTDRRRVEGEDLPLETFIQQPFQIGSEMRLERLIQFRLYNDDYIKGTV
jgi:hypothetical protein